MKQPSISGVWVFVALLVRQAKSSLSAECLGNATECYSFIENGPQTVSALLPEKVQVDICQSEDLHAEKDSISFNELKAFVADGEVCDLSALFKLHPVYGIKVLAGLQDGIKQAVFPNSEHQLSTWIHWCRLTQHALNLLTNKLQQVCNLEDEGGSLKGLKDSLEMIRDGWFVSSRDFYEKFEFLSEDKYPESLPQLVTLYVKAIDQSFGRILSTGSTTSTFKQIASQEILRSSFSLRKASERLRYVVGVKTLRHQMSEVYDLSGFPFPRLTYHDEVYGRHWDVLEVLMRTKGLKSFVEIGVALGGLALSLDRRFAQQLNYVGVDPFMKADVVENLSTGYPHLRLIQETSDNAASFFEDESVDVVFVDGPHTYANVRNDIIKWFPKLKAGGLMCGHDFTPQHPFLMWAVIEQAVTRGIPEVHIATDGVWWY